MFSHYHSTSPNLSEISTPSFPPPSPPMASLEQQLQEALGVIDSLTQRIESLTTNLENLQHENQILRDLQQSILTHPIQSMFSPPLPPQQSPPHSSASRPLPQLPQISPSHLPLPSSPPAQGFKDPKIATPIPFTGKQNEIESFIHSCILYINGRPSEFGTEQNKVIWILSYMQTGAARAWRDYIMAQICKRTLWFHTTDDLLKEIEQKFGDTDKHTTMSLKF